MANGKKYTLEQRREAARVQTIERPAVVPPGLSNKEEVRYHKDGYAGSFTKLLHHGQDGALSDDGAENYEALRKALLTGKQEDFNGVERANKGDSPSRVWINPQAAFSTTLEGGDISLQTLQSAPRLSSPEAAAEMIEVYLYLLCRDVRFSEYGTGEGGDKMASGHSITRFAADTLTQLGEHYKGPKGPDGTVSPELLFRGLTDGDLGGPLVSQYLLQPLYPLFPSGCAPFVGGLIGVGELDQDALARPQLFVAPGSREFGTTWEHFREIQNGFIPEAYTIEDYPGPRRYLVNGRDLGSLVHTDSPYEAYYNALGILAYRDAPRTQASPYVQGKILNEGDGHSLGVPDAYALVASACIEAFKSAWFQKWRVHRRLRPEAMAAWVQRAYLGVEIDGKNEISNPYNLHSLLFGGVGGPVLQKVLERSGDARNVLLPQMYPEGSPAHPAYPSGHATVAGACTTVLKALFNQDRPLLGEGGDGPFAGDLFTPIKPNPEESGSLVAVESGAAQAMTVGSELDKLASNISYGRNFGGVHFRSDGDGGMELGEEVAIRLLQDHARVYHETGFNGFVLTKRDGQRVHIGPHDVHPAD